MDTKHYRELSKYVTFQVASYWYVIPVTEILKIVNCPPPSQGGMVGLGLVQLGPHTIQLVDLNQIFEHELTNTVSITPSFLIVLHQQENTLWGIALDTPPDLIELSSNDLKPVSLAEHSAPQSPWITHVGVVNKQNSEQAFLQLDLRALFRHKVKQSVSSLSS